MFAKSFIRIAVAGLFAAVLLPACTETYGTRSASDDAALNPSRSGAYNPYSYNDSYPNFDRIHETDRATGLGLEDR